MIYGRSLTAKATTIGEWRGKPVIIIDNESDAVPEVAFIPVDEVAWWVEREGGSMVTLRLHNRDTIRLYFKSHEEYERLVSRLWTVGGDA